MTRVRFAPSPTGQVHIGNMRVALFNWLFARHTGGQFLLRIEDTDRERSTLEAVQQLRDAMDWFNLDIDDKPMFQSSRAEAHLAAARELLKKGLAFKEDKGGTGKGECVVFKMPAESITFHDQIKGELCKAAEDMKDFVIVRSDGTAVFHLANVVDDIEMNISHVIRGDDHVENTYRHIALYRALGAELPTYAHLPMIVNQHGKPYSKRDGDAFVGDFRAKGFHPDALFNYLILLGWSPGDDREKMTREESIKLFSLDRVKSGPAQLDIKKLTHLNASYIDALPLDEFVRSADAIIRGTDWARDIDQEYFRKVCALMQSRTHLYSYTQDWKYFFSDEYPYEEKGVRKELKKEGIKAVLQDVRKQLEHTDFSEETIEHIIRETEAAAGIPKGKLNQSIRVAVTGRSAGAGLYETMELLGKQRVLARLDTAVATLGTVKNFMKE